jgi:hypothetical protein
MNFKDKKGKLKMKTKLIAIALLASAALIAPLHAGGGNHSGGGGNFAGGGGRAAARGGGPSFGAMPGRFGGGPAFRSMPMRSFSGGNRTIYSGQRFSSVGPRTPTSMEFRPRTVNSNSNMSIRSRQFAQGNMNRGIDNAHLANRGNPATTNPGRAGNGAAQVRNGKANLRPDWHNHVFAQHSGEWHRDWDRSRDHWWHGHRCHFFNGAWFIFDAGFDPWWPWWYYPYDYYGYGYPYPYSYGYDSGYSDSGDYDDQNGYADQSGNSTVAAVQERLARDGYYRGQVDGVFGSETRAAIAEFQSNRGLRVTGSLTQQTLAALGLRQVASY